VRCFSGAPLFMLNSSSISLFSMSVLKKIQFAYASNSGAGAVECQKPVRFANASRIAPCFIAAR
ncbi:MAG: hypothetical protein J0626_07095, partial [Rhodospirillaceae bacterium]|nr:hypothetical protein [Rhodospirillaceae bacterium]